MSSYVDMIDDLRQCVSTSLVAKTGDPMRDFPILLLEFAEQDLERKKAIIANLSVPIGERVLTVVHDGAHSHFMTESMVDNWWGNLSPEEKAAIYKADTDKPTAYSSPDAMWVDLALRKGLCAVVEQIDDEVQERIDKRMRDTEEAFAHLNSLPLVKLGAQ